MPENLLELPNEILQFILNFLKAYELELGASQACKQLNEVAYTLPYYRISRFFKIADYPPRLSYYSAQEVCTYLTLPENKHNSFLEKAVSKYFSSPFVPSKEEAKNLIEHGLSGNADLARTVFRFFTHTSFIVHLPVKQATALCIKAGNPINLNAAKSNYKTATGVDLNEEIKKIPNANDSIVIARIDAANNSHSNLMDFFNNISKDAVLVQHLTPRDAALLCIKVGNTASLNAAKSNYKTATGVDLDEVIKKIPNANDSIVAARIDPINNKCSSLMGFFNNISKDAVLVQHLTPREAALLCIKVGNTASLNAAKSNYKTATGVDLDEVIEKIPDAHSRIIAARMQYLLERKQSNPGVNLKSEAKILFNSIINDTSLVYYLTVGHAIWFCIKVGNQADSDSLKLKYKEKTGIDIDQYILEQNPIIETAETKIKKLRM